MGNVMISHVFIGVNDFGRACRFYAALLAGLQLVQKFCDEDAAMAGWMAPDSLRPLFLIGRPYNGQPAEAGNGQMTALLASSRQMVDRVYQLALEQGGQSEGEPGLRPHYHPHYYGAYFRDLDGNKLCVCCHDPE